MIRVFVIAMECEAESVRPSMRPGDRLYISGIGKVNAAATVQKAICCARADGLDFEVINAGLCGGFGDVEVCRVYEVESAVEYDFDLAKLNGTSVGVLNERTSPWIPLAVNGLFPQRILATGDHFNDEESDFELITRELKCSLRDMEGAAIAHVCEREGVRCREYKCVSDVAGEGSMTQQYQNNRERALAVLTDAMRNV